MDVPIGQYTAMRWTARRHRAYHILLKLPVNVDNKHMRIAAVTVAVTVTIDDVFAVTAAVVHNSHRCLHYRCCSHCYLLQSQSLSLALSYVVSHLVTIRSGLAIVQYL